MSPNAPVRNNHLANLLRLPKVGMIVLTSVLASLFQSLGLSLFVPLIKMLVSKDAELPFPFDRFPLVFDALGIPFEVPHVLAFIVTLNVIGLILVFAQRSLVMAYAFPRYTRETSAVLVESLLDSSWHYIARQATGEITNHLLQEVFRAARALSHLADAAAATIQILIYLVFAFVLSPVLLIFAIAFGAALVVIVQPFQRRSYRLAQDLTDANNRLGYHIVDFLSNLKLVKAMAAERWIAGQLDRFRKDTCDITARRQLVLNLTHLIVQILPVVLMAVAIGLGALVFKTDPVMMLVFFIFLARAAPLATQIQQAVQSYFMELPAVEVIDQAIAASNAEKEEPGDARAPFGSFRTAVRFEEVCLRFPDADADTLKNLSLTIERGQFIAVVGPSGSGKSTLIDILCGLRVPTRGRIEVDGHDLQEFDLRSWRRRLGYVTQDVAILNDSFRNNVRFTRPEATDDDVREAIGLAQINDVVRTLSDGMDTVLGERGVRLSGGQRQRLALARALVGRPDILLLDEATSALDNESEKAIQDALESVSHRFTIVAIAHRLSTVRKADVIYVMEDGRIVEHGSYDILRRSKGRFSQMHDLELSAPSTP